MPRAVFLVYSDGAPPIVGESPIGSNVLPDLDEPPPLLREVIGGLLVRIYDPMFVVDDQWNKVKGPGGDGWVEGPATIIPMSALEPVPWIDRFARSWRGVGPRLEKLYRTALEQQGRQFAQLDSAIQVVKDAGVADAMASDLARMKGEKAR